MQTSLQELEDILLVHAKRYPLAQPQDFVKLIYQNEFGPGHLITDSQKCFGFLLAEMEKTKKRPDAPLFEEIGNGLVRVNLCALPKDYSPSSLCADFMATAQAHSGNMDSFLKKLEVLKLFCAKNSLAFAPPALEQYLAAYGQAGYPMVSHSQIYRDAYSPAYRVVKKEQVLYRLPALHSFL